MLLFAIDDEPRMLHLLHKAIAEAEPDAEIMDFTEGDELLAYLIDREGAYCAAGEIIGALWEDGTGGKDAKGYLRVLTNDLSAVLKSVGMNDLLLKKRGQLAVDRSKLDCDYYRMREGDSAAVNAYRGEYMKQYSWAELTTGKLHFHT